MRSERLARKGEIGVRGGGGGEFLASTGRRGGRACSADRKLDINAGSSRKAVHGAHVQGPVGLARGGGRPGRRGWTRRSGAAAGRPGSHSSGI